MELCAVACLAGDLLKGPCRQASTKQAQEVPGRRCNACLLDGLIEAIPARREGQGVKVQSWPPPEQALQRATWQLAPGDVSDGSEVSQSGPSQSRKEPPWGARVLGFKVQDVAVPLKVSFLPKQPRGLNMHKGGRALLRANAGRHSGLKATLRCWT